MKLTLLALELAAIAALLACGRWKRVPLFVVYLLATVPLTASFAPTQESWWHGVFEALAPVHVLLAITVTAEALRNSTEDAQRPFTTWLWTLMASLGVAALIVVWELNDHGTTFRIIRDGRAAVLCGLAVASIIGLTAVWVFPSSLLLFDERHLKLWTMLMFKGGSLALCGRMGLFPGPWGARDGYADTVGGVVTIACLLLWIRAAAARNRIV